MDDHSKVEKWLQEMGYDGKIPNLKGLCNAKTMFIWHQLIEKVKPKQEVAYKRNNIIINRLLKDDLNDSDILQCQSETRYPVREIELWESKIQLENDITEAEDEVFELEKEVKTLEEQNKMKCIHLKKRKKKVEENEKYSFLLRAKMGLFNEELVRVEDMLAWIKNVTPTESTEHVNRVDALETLKKCSEKLQNMVDNQSSFQVSSIHRTRSLCSLDKIDEQPLTPRRRLFSVIKQQKTSVFKTKAKTLNGNVHTDTDDLNNTLGLLHNFDSLDKSDLLSSKIYIDGSFGYEAAILEDPSLKQLIHHLLYKSSRFVVWNSFQAMNEQWKKKFLDQFLKPSINSGDMHEKNHTEITRLYSDYVSSQLDVVKQKLNVSKLEVTLQGLHENLFANLLAEGVPEQQLEKIKEVLDVQENDAAMNAALLVLHKELDKLKSSLEYSNDLQLAEEKLKVVDDQITSKVATIEDKIQFFNCIRTNVLNARGNTVSAMRKLHRFLNDLSWTLPLSQNLSSNEIRVFVDFPLEYNRKLLTNDLSMDYELYDDDLDPSVLHEVLRLIDNPFINPETILLNLIKDKIRVAAWKSLKFVPVDKKCVTYSLEELENQELYITDAADKLLSSAHSQVSKRAIAVATKTKEDVKLWLQTPINKVISDNRVLNGKTYDYYEQLYENYYKQL